MSLRDSLKKAASLLVEFPEEEAAEFTESAPANSAPSMDDLDARLAANAAALGSIDGSSAPRTSRTVEQIVRDTAGPNLDEIKVTADQPERVVSEAGTMDFAEIYRQAQLPPCSFSAEQMLEMLASLPAELPLETRRQTVKVTLNSLGKSLGATPDTVVADASRKLAALAAYVDDITHRTAEFAAATKMEIAALEQQIADKRNAIERIQQRQVAVASGCAKESDRLDDVLEFFSLDVAPSKYA